ncbi:MAG: DUF2723 domain-containing protein [Gemmatimonadaceae bacterium]|nr:DUF2723 domain-containing protein [Gemmatimonadaceae bacterium]
MISRECRSAVAAGVALLAAYSATLAPGLTLWDSGEFLAAIHSLGIPHPPGTPLYVIVANVWAQLFGPLLGFAKSVNLFSAVCAAAGCALLAHLFSRWTRDPYAGFGAAVCAGATSTLWLSATETEVYAPAFFVSMLLLWVANEASVRRDARYPVLFGYVAGLSWALHLTVLIAFPAALVLGAHAFLTTLSSGRRKVLLRAVFAGLFGASVVAFMYFRARFDPQINQGNPGTLSALADVISRKQYGDVSIFQRQAPLFLQFGNVFEWADWQFALGLDQKQPPGWLRTSVTVVFALLGFAGFFAHRKLDRRSWRAMSALFVAGFIGVVFYLNLKAGPSYGAGFLEDGALHEARERDYFFILAWISWGAWAGVGAMEFGRRIVKGAAAIPVGLLVASSPILLNWQATNRNSAPDANEAARFASEILALAPDRAVLLAQADNDTYPVWYSRVVMRARPDVVPITIPLLSAAWYREEVARRYKLLDADAGIQWKGTDGILRAICERARIQGRPVVGPFDRDTRLMPLTCLKFEREDL